MRITVDKINESVFVTEGNSGTLGRRQGTVTRRWFCRNHNQKRVKTLIRFIGRKRNLSSVFFLTLTTQQHKTGKTDSELVAALGIFLRRISKEYVAVAERQRDTRHDDPTAIPSGDLHFHIVYVGRKLDFRKCIRRLCVLFGAVPSPQLITNRQVWDWNGVQYYVSKYTSKRPMQFWWQYQKNEERKAAGRKPLYADFESMICSRTVFISKRLGASYEQSKEDHLVKHEASYFMMQRFIGHLEPTYMCEYFTTYPYTSALFDRVKKEVDYLARRNRSPEEIFSLN